MHKLLLSLALNAVLLCATAAQTDPCLGPNVWFNGDFEQSTDELASGWNPACFPLTTPYPTITTSLPNGFYPFFDFDHTFGTGGHFIWMDFSLTNCFTEGTNEPLLSQTLTTVPGQTYQFSMWTRVHCSDIGGSFGLEIDGNLLETVDLQALAQFFNCMSGWQQFTVDFIATSTQTTFSVVNVNWMSWGYDFAFDDIAVQTIGISSTLTLSPDTTICPGQCALLSAEGAPGGTYAWSPAASLNDPNSPTPEACPATTTTYTLTYTGATGCTNTGEITVNVTTGSLPVSVTGDEDLCPEFCAQLFAAGGETYSWSPAIGLSDPGSAATEACPAATTTYTVTVTAAGGCTGTAEVTLTVLNLDDAGLPDSLTVCAGTCEVLSPLVGESFLWSNGSADPTLNICPLAPGAFSVTVTLSNGCEITDTTRFSILPAPFPVLTDSVRVCPGACFPLETDEWSSYLWSTGDTTASVLICGNEFPDSVVWLEVTNEYGCSGMDSTLVFFDNTSDLSVELESPQEIILGDELTLNPVLNVPVWQIDSLHWEPPTGLSCDDCLYPSASPELGTAYTIWLQDVNGCTASASLLILVKTPPVYVPNVFYPESSVGNERFTVFAKDGTVERVQLLQVFDRWGELMFDGKDFPANDLASGWDGFFRGKKMDAQVLVWQARVLMRNGEVVFLKGEVVLLN